jgi:hypothetical protein
MLKGQVGRAQRELEAMIQKYPLTRAAAEARKLVGTGR